MVGYHIWINVFKLKILFLASLLTQVIFFYTPINILWYFRKIICLIIFVWFDVIYHLVRNFKFFTLKSYHSHKPHRSKKFEACRNQMDYQWFPLDYHLQNSTKIIMVFIIKNNVINFNNKIFIMRVDQ